MKEKGKLIESPRETDGLKSSCGESRAETEVAFPPNAHSVPRSATLDTAGLTQVSPHMNLNPVASYWAEYHNRPVKEADLEMCHFAEHWRLREAEAPRKPLADERTKFENWAKGKNLPTMPNGDVYVHVESQMAWEAWQARAELRDAESPRQPQSSVPSHGAAEIGAGAENTAGVRDLTIRTPMPPTNCWCSNDSATCKECWPERAGSPRQPKHDLRNCPAMRALESLTPGGSEYIDDIPRWVATARESRDSVMRVLVQTKKQLNELEVSQHPVPAPENNEIYEKCARIAESYYWNCSDNTCPGCMTAKNIAEHIREAEHYSGQLAPNPFPEPKAECEHPERATKSTQCTCEKCKGQHPEPAKGGGR